MAMAMAMARIIMCVMMFAFAFASASASASGSLGKLSRDGAFVGYFEERGLRLVAAKDAGSILVRLRPSVMPRTAAMLAEAVAKPMGADNLNGTWYRNEAVPLPSEGNGPPYGLLQGKMIGITFPKDENDEHVGNGTVCAIPDSDAFLINTMDHEEWKGSFTILGYVPLDDAESWATIRRIIDRKWKLLVHPDYGTHMRMLEEEVPFTVLTEEEHSIREMEEAKRHKDKKKGVAPAAAPPAQDVQK